MCPSNSRSEWISPSPSDYFAVVFFQIASFSSLTTTRSSPRSSITFTAIWPRSPAPNGALVVPASDPICLRHRRSARLS